MEISREELTTLLELTKAMKEQLEALEARAELLARRARTTGEPAPRFTRLP